MITLRTNFVRRAWCSMIRTPIEGKQQSSPEALHQLQVTIVRIQPKRPT